MKLNELTALGIRLLGIYLLIRAFTTLIAAISSSMSNVQTAYGDLSPFLYFGITEAIVFFLCAFGLIKFPVYIANKITPKSPEESSGLHANGELLEKTAFVVIGVYILTWAVPDLLDNSIYLFQLKSFVPHDNQAWYETWGLQVVTVFEIAIGLYLTLGAKGLHKTIVRLRQ
jgi:hypothetical protein